MQMPVEAGSILEVRVCMWFFRKRAKNDEKMLKKGKIFEKLGKNVHVIIAHNKLLEKALRRVNFV